MSVLVSMEVQSTDTKLSSRIRNWDHHNFYYYSMLSSLAKHYRFDLDIPFKKLSKKNQDILLYGSNDVEIQFRYIQDNNQVVNRKHAFEGVIPNMERRYH